MTDRSDPPKPAPESAEPPAKSTGKTRASAPAPSNARAVGGPAPIAISETEIAALKLKARAGDLPVRAPGGDRSADNAAGAPASASQQIRIQTVDRLLSPAVTHKAHPRTDAQEETSDAKLVMRSMDGNNQAFEELYHRYLSRAIVAAYAVLGQREKAQDVAQEAFIEAANKLNTLREPENFGGWVCGISRRMAIVAVRKESRRLNAIRDHQEELREKPRHDEPDQAAVKDEQKKLIRRAIAMVPPNYREILLAKYVEKLSYDEIAATCGISRAAVDKRLTRGKQLLRKIMEDLMGEGGGLK